jgi:hypothetical protein
LGLFDPLKEEDEMTVTVLQEEKVHVFIFVNNEGSTDSLLAMYIRSKTLSNLSSFIAITDAK